MKLLLAAFVLACSVGVGGVASAQCPSTTVVTEEPAVVVVQTAPPPLVVEVITVRPSVNHVWVGGYWHWTGMRYYWVGGGWHFHQGYVWHAPLYSRVRVGSGWAWHYRGGYWHRHH